MAEQSLIEAMTNDLVDDEINRNGWSDEYAAHMRADVKFRGRCARQARAALRSILDHGPTPAMLRRAVECRHGPATYKAVPKAATDAYEQEAADDFRAMIAAELEGGQ